MRRWMQVLLVIFVMSLTLVGCRTAQEHTAAETQASGVPETQQEETDILSEGSGEENSGSAYEAEGEEMALPDLPEKSDEISETETVLPEDGVYTSKEDVALYIYLYGRLPSNFITKKDAQALGWEGGSLEPYAPGMCIGGSYFGNYEGLLPEEDGRTYMECDIDTLGADRRGAKRIVFSNDGLVYYTEDHYQSFELLYGEES